MLYSIVLDSYYLVKYTASFLLAFAAVTVQIQIVISILGIRNRCNFVQARISYNLAKGAVGDTILAGIS